jgi:hypothetical protein
VTCRSAWDHDALVSCRLYPAPYPDVWSDVNASTESPSRSLGERFVLALLWCVWQAIRLPTLGVLVILEPVVRVILSGFALIMMLTAFLFEFASSRPFPFWGVLAVALGAFGLLVLYEGLIRLLSGGHD